MAIGGRLVIPVGDFEHEQSLLRLTRRSDFEYEEEAFGAVRFVPLIGEHGWAEDGTRSASNHVPGQAQFRSLPDMIRAAVANDPDSFLDAAQNARLVASAERYYRIMYYGGAESWNLRDTHMFETLGHILEAQGPQSKAVVWAHNSHIGDARFTEMGVVREELNLGQLCRNKFAGAACLVGFGTHRGTVAAASDWDGEMEVMQVRASRPDSYERQFHDAGVARGLLEFRRDESLRRRLIEPRLERFIGVIYRPDTELQSH